MNLLIISDQIKNEDIPTDRAAPEDKCLVVAWRDRYETLSLGELHVLIVDFSFEHCQGKIIQELHLELRERLPEYVKQGLILICVCGYSNEVIYTHQSVPGESTEDVKSYDFLLKQDFISDLENINNSMFKNFGCLSRRSEFLKDYFKYVSEHRVTFSIKKKKNANDIKVHCRSKGVEKRPIAVGFGLGEANGYVLLLPGYLKEHKEKIAPILISLSRYCHARKQLKEPEWISYYRINRYTELVEDIAIKKVELDKYNTIAGVLFMKDKVLENSVMDLLQDLDMKVTKAEEGAPIDIKAVYDTLNVKFAIEVKGSDKKLTVNDGPRQLLEYVGYPDYKKEEKIILLANAYCHLYISDRYMKENFTERAYKTLSTNKFLMMTTIDLYFLWKAVKERVIDKEFAIKAIKNAEEVFELPDICKPDFMKAQS